MKSDDYLFVHTSIRTRNMNRSIEFYSRLLDLKLLNRREIPKNDAEIAFLRDPEAKGATLELTFYRKQIKFSQPEYEERIFDHLAFEVKDIETCLAAMRNQGVTITDDVFRLSPTGPLIAFVEDPDGTLIELIEKNREA
jgi:lactoylglutathione lyase